jgi:heat shock protein HslJ
MKTAVLLLTFIAVAVLPIAAACAAPPPPTPPSPPPAPISLENTTWVLKFLGSPESPKPVLATTEVNITFLANGRITGKSGCNTYNGQAKIEGSSFTVASPMASTMMACPQPVMDQETEYLKALQAAQSFKVTGNQLKITAGKTELTFEKK